MQENELHEDGTIKENLTVRQEGSRRVRRKVLFYNLDMIISVGYRVNSVRGTQFRIWATRSMINYRCRFMPHFQRKASAFCHITPALECVG